LLRAVFLDRIIRIVSMVAQMAAIAMTGLKKRICDITFPPMVPQAHGDAFRQARTQSANAADPAEHFAGTPIAPPANNLAGHHCSRLD
jgi:hypothetical protein